MSKIRILPEIISNKIAAGEVVERPASVVKELVENALDAGSSKIIIEVEKGGRSLIRVSDNGAGMKHDDALLALERYATSKIYSDQDLFSIRTLGFRGEALPSIAAVSRFTLITRAQDADSGTQIQVEGGKIKQVAEIGAPPGTMVTVGRLFYNTPARRKFLKTVNTEMGHIADVTASIALGRPEVHFKLVHNSKTVKSWPAVSDRKDRAVDVLGRDMRDDLYRIQKEHDGVALSGWTSSPRVSRSTSRAIFIFVNGRFARDRIIQHALFEGYTQRLVKGQFPVAVIYITVPFDQVDVNVHPTKNEVRFARHRMVHDLVKAAVAEAVDREDRPKWGVDDSRERSKVQDLGLRIQDREKVQSSKFKVQSQEIKTRRNISEAQATFGYLDPVSSIQHPVSDHLDPVSSIQHPASRDERGIQREQAAIWSKKKFSDLRIIGQIHNTYIVCEAQDRTILIDQHAAHERILYEKLKHRSQPLKKESQKLLVPETVEFGYREAGILKKLIPEFEGLGLEIEPFGGNTFVVKAVPALLAGREAKPLIVEIVEKLADTGFAAGLEQSLDECHKLMACHGAIRAHQVLSDKQMQGLLAQLDACENPAHCPHGRPTWIEWNNRELEKLFNRIV